MAHQTPTRTQEGINVSETLLTQFANDMRDMRKTMTDIGGEVAETRGTMKALLTAFESATFGSIDRERVLVERLHALELENARRENHEGRIKLLESGVQALVENNLRAAVEAANKHAAEAKEEGKADGETNTYKALAKFFSSRAVIIVCSVLAAILGTVALEHLRAPKPSAVTVYQETRPNMQEMQRRQESSGTTVILPNQQQQ